jgi:DNA-binding SARP family transcriptional activator
MRKRVTRARAFWLGHPRIERDEAPVRLDTRKTTALLAYLSLADRPMSRERLAALFWPDFDQERAPANLRRSLAALRAALPGQWLAAERDRIGVHLSEELWVDVRETRLLIAGVKAHPHDDLEACPECRARLQQAAALYQGDFLEGFTLPDCPEFDDWQLAERESIRSDQGWALERLARAEASEGQWEPGCW